MNFSLVQSPEDKSSYPFKIQGSIEKDKQKIKIIFTVDGEVEKINFPSHKNSQRRFCLWENTCFELFFKNGDENISEYWECNFAPSTEWNIFHFLEYRKDIKEENNFTEINIQISKQNKQFNLSVEIDLAKIGRNFLDLSVAISAVIKDKLSEKSSYWALMHNKEKADFHDPYAYIKL